MVDNFSHIVVDKSLCKNLTKLHKNTDKKIVFCYFIFCYLQSTYRCSNHYRLRLKEYSFSWKTHLKVTERHLPYGIAPNTGEYAPP